MQIYEDEVSQTLARSLIPYEEIRNANMENGKVNEFNLVKGLLNWFKNDFFSWTNSPKCHLCGGETTGTPGRMLNDNFEGINSA